MSAKFLYVNDVTGIISEASASPIVTTNTFAAVSSVAAGSETLIGGYTVPAGKTFALERVHFSGDNIAKYSVYVDAIKVATARTMFGGDLTGEINLSASLSLGQPVASGAVITVKVIHNRPLAGNFEAVIIGGLVG